MQKYIFFFLILLFCNAALFSQKLSLNEFLDLKNMPLNKIDSLMKLKRFTRWDTAASDLKFRFYGYSNGSATGLRYLQIAIIDDLNYPEIQYQTSLKKESLEMQQQLIADGFIKTVIETPNAANTLQLSYKKNLEQVDYSEEPVSDSTIILYTFKISSDHKKNMFLKNL